LIDGGIGQFFKDEEIRTLKNWAFYYSIIIDDSHLNKVYNLINTTLKVSNIRIDTKTLSSTSNNSSGTIQTSDLCKSNGLSIVTPKSVYNINQKYLFDQIRHHNLNVISNLLQDCIAIESNVMKV